jgi:hypothetical protein
VPSALAYKKKGIIVGIEFNQLQSALADKKKGIILGIEFNRLPSALADGLRVPLYFGL